MAQSGDDAVAPAAATEEPQTEAAPDAADGVPAEEGDAASTAAGPVNTAKPAGTTTAAATSGFAEDEEQSESVSCRSRKPVSRAGMKKLRVLMTTVVVQNRAVRAALSKRTVPNSITLNRVMHKVRVSNMLESTGSTIEFLSPGETLGSLTAKIKASFKYERDAILFMPSNFHAQETRTKMDTLHSIVMPARFDMQRKMKKLGMRAKSRNVGVKVEAFGDREHINTTQKLWDVIQSWEAASGRRRIHAVENILSKALEKLEGDTPAQRLMGADQMLEMTAQTVNLKRYKSEHTEELLARLCDNEECLSVRNAVANVLWTWMQADSNVCALMAEEHKIHEKLCAAIRHVQTMQDEDCIDEAAEPGSKYQICNRGEILGMQGLIGCLGFLIGLQQVQSYICTVEGITLLLDVTEQLNNVTASTAAEALCRLLVMRWHTRKVLIQAGLLPRLRQNLNSSSTDVCLCAASAIHTIVKEKRSRKMLGDVEAALCFVELNRLAKWCLGELSETRDAVGSNGVSGGMRFAFLRREDLIPRMLSYCLAAMFGLVSVIHPPGSLFMSDGMDVLKGHIHDWTPVLMDICKIEDSRLDRCVGTAASNALGHLAHGLSHDILPAFPNILKDLVDVVESTAPIKQKEGAAASLACFCSNSSDAERLYHDHSHYPPHRAVTKDAAFMYDFVRKGGCERMCQVINDEGRRTTGTMERHLAIAIMHCSTMPGSWPHADLKEVTALLASHNKLVVLCASQSLWCLAHDQQNRAALGALHAVDGLTSVMRANSEPRLKESCLSALWLLSCEQANAVRVAVRGGLQLAVGICHFPMQAPYMTMKALAIGLLGELVQTDDINQLMASVSIARPLLDGIHSEQTTPYCKLLSAGLLFKLADCPEQLRRLQEVRGRYVMEDAFTAMMQSPILALQQVGLYAVTVLAMKVPSKIRFGKNGCVRWLINHFEHSLEQSASVVKPLHAILNISTHKDNQVEICHRGLRSLLLVTSFADSVESEFATSILTNLSNNVTCRTAMYKYQLQHSSDALQQAKMLNGSSFFVDEISDERISEEGQKRRRAFEDFIMKFADSEDRGSDEESSFGTESEPGVGLRSRATSAASLGTPASPAMRLRPQTSLDSRGLTTRGSRLLTGQVGLGNSLETSQLSSAREVSIEQRRVLFKWVRYPVTALWEDQMESKTLPALKPSTGQSVQINSTGQFPIGGGHGEGSIGTVFSRPQTTDSAFLNPSALQQPSLLTSASERQSFRPGSVASRRGPGGLSGSLTQNSMAPLAPLRSSHRVGPVGKFGSVDHRRGEDRWQPRITTYKEVHPEFNLVEAPAALDKRRPSTVASSQPSSPTASQAAAAAATPGAAPADGADVATPASPTALVADSGAGTWSKGVGSKPTTPLGTAATGGAASPVARTGKSKRKKKLTEQEWKAERARMALARQRQVTLEPFSGYNQFTFHATDFKRGFQSPVTLCKFKRVPGSTVYDGLFNHFVGANGDECYFYHHSAIACEALDPGGLPRPEPPLKQEQILLHKFPVAPALVVSDSETPPLMYLPDLPMCPPVCKHAVPACMLAGILGGVANEPAPLLCVMKEPAAEKEEEEVKNKWTVETSNVFCMRKREADSKTFWDTDQTIRRTLVIDWKRLLAEDRFIAFIRKNDDDATTMEALEEELSEVKLSFQRSYGNLLRIYDYYCAISGATGRSAHAIQQNMYMKFISDCCLADDNLTSEYAQQVFVQVNFEEETRSLQAEVNEDKALMRHEFLEALVRLAVKKYQHDVPDVSECVDTLLAHIMENIPKDATVNPDDFRTQRLYSEEVEKVLQSHMTELQVIFEQLSMLNPLFGKAKFGLDEAVTLYSSLGCVGEEVLQTNLREIRLAFFMSRMTVIDEVKHRFKFTTLSFIEFLEFLARNCDSSSVPTDADLKAIGADSIMDFQLALGTLQDEKLRYLLDRRPSAGFMSISERPFAAKFDRYLRNLIGRMGIRNKGTLTRGRVSIRFVPKYVTSQHIEQMKWW